MKNLIALLFICIISVNVSASDIYGGIKLLEGYKVKKDSAVDSVAWTIYKKEGLTIEFEAGLNQGFAADKNHIEQYAWYQEQEINGNKVMLALIKPNLKTVFEPSDPRSKETGNILLVTFPLGIQQTNAANFQAEILNEQEMIDALLMIMTFNPKKFE
jgi:hypothetical protein